MRGGIPPWVIGVIKIPERGQPGLLPVQAPEHVRPDLLPGAWRGPDANLVQFTPHRAGPVGVPRTFAEEMEAPVVESGETGAGRSPLDQGAVVVEKRCFPRRHPGHMTPRAKLKEIIGGNQLSNSIATVEKTQVGIGTLVLQFQQGFAGAIGIER